MEFTKLLEERRSIRAFDPEKHVTAEQIQEIVQAAIQAPSWKNSQTTRYYALVTPEKVEEFSAKCLPEFNQKSSKGAALVVTAFVKDRSGFTQDGTPDNEVGNGWGYCRRGSSCCWPDDGDHRSVEITKQGAELRALFNDTVSFHKIKYCYILLGNSLLI